MRTSSEKASAMIVLTSESMEVRLSHFRRLAGQQNGMLGDIMNEIEIPFDQWHCERLVSKSQR